MVGTVLRYMRRDRFTEGFHGLRHTCADRLRASGTQEAIIASILGHAHPGMTSRYGSGWDVQARAKAIASIKYEGLN
jgi:integrase